jgi:hypothetical protein
MKKKLFCGMLAWALLITQMPLTIAQTARNWANVQAITVDERVIVKQKDGKTIEGRMIEASEANLSITRKNKVVNMPRANISAVYRSTGKATKGKWAAIGTGIGAGAGAGIGAIKYSPNVDDSEIWIGMGFIIGAGVGAVTGLLFGASRRKRTLLYQAP